MDRNRTCFWCAALDQCTLPLWIHETVRQCPIVASHSSKNPSSIIHEQSFSLWNLVNKDLLAFLTTCIMIRVHTSCSCDFWKLHQTCWTVWKVLTCPESHNSLPEASCIVHGHKTGWQHRGWPSPWWLSCPSISSGSLPSDRCDKSTGMLPVHHKDKVIYMSLALFLKRVKCFEQSRLCSSKSMHNTNHLYKDECLRSLCWHFLEKFYISRE